MKTLKNALHRMQAYYREIKERPQPTAEEQSQLKFPEVRELTGIKFTYTKRLWSNVFEPTTNEENPRHVIVKFVEQYSTEDHKLCEGLDFAPELLTTNPVPVTSCYFMVVMLFVEGAKTLRCFTFNKPEDREAVKRLCQDILRNLHDKGFCHGDFCNSNILVVPTTDKYTISVIDFDWDGKTGVAVYPLFMNHWQLEWHSSASDGKPLLPEHDLHWLDRIFP